MARPPPHCPDETLREMRFCQDSSRSWAPWQWCRWLTHYEEASCFRRCHRLLHILMWAHKNQGQLHEGNLRGSRPLIWILDTRFVEADAFREAAFPRVVRLSFPVQ